MNYYLLMSLIFATLSGLFSLTRQLQMLQQNSYFPSRYTSWLKDNLPHLNIVFFFIVSVLFNLGFDFVLMAVTLLTAAINIRSSVRTQKNSIKKLVFTGRIKRLFGCAVIIFVLLLGVYIAIPKTLTSKISVAVIWILAYASPLLTYICWALTLPIEKAFSRWYINDAKRILKQHKNLKVVGITGSYGKTTTKFILTRILSEKYNVVCTPQSFNTPMGVVRTIREKLQPQTEIFVCEMGAKNIGDIKEICDIVNPDYALITSVGAQHLETFKTVDNVFKTKFELADAVLSKNGKVLANFDSTEIKTRADNKTIISYGTDEQHTYTAKNIACNRYGSEFDVCVGNDTIKLSTRLLGMHSIINITGAAGLAYELGLSAEEIRYAVSSLKPTEHRLEIKSTVNSSVMIDDAYNANPEGCIEAVHVLGTFGGMQKVIITPGLIELGEKEYECNYNLGLEAAKICDIIILVGKNRSKPMADAVNSTEFDKTKLFIASSFSEAMEIYSEFANSNTVVLVENDLPDNYLN